MPFHTRLAQRKCGDTIRICGRDYLNHPLAPQRLAARRDKRAMGNRYSVPGNQESTCVPFGPDLRTVAIICLICSSERETRSYQFIAHDGVQIGAIMQVMPQTPAPIWNHYFWVASIAAAKTAIEANGGQVINGPVQVPDGNWIVQGIDPQGAFFSLVGGE